MSLPATIEALIGIIGHSKTRDLVREFGGQNLRIPRTEMSEVWGALVEVIGEKATRRLSDALGGEGEIYISKCDAAMRDDRNRKMIQRYDQLMREGHSARGATSVLVREVKLSYRQIEIIVNAPVPEAAGLALQGQLF